MQSKGIIAKKVRDFKLGLASVSNIIYITHLTQVIFQIPTLAMEIIAARAMKHSVQQVFILIKGRSPY